MKKVFLSLAVLGMISLASCNKEKDCECVTEGGGMDNTTTVTIEEGDCSDMDTETSSGGMTVTTTCTEV